MTAIWAGAAAALAGLAGWHLAVRRWPYTMASGMAWLGLSRRRRTLLALVCVLAGAMAGLGWDLAPAAAMAAAVVLAGAVAIMRAVRAAVARREG